MKKNTKELKQKKETSILLLVFLTTIFGLGAGITGTLIMKYSILQDVYDIPFSSEINLTHDKLRNANLVIENAKKIIVEQDEKVYETINSSKNSLVGLFKKIVETKNNRLETKNNNIDISEYYRLNDILAEGIIFTSDGWVLINGLNSQLIGLEFVNDYLVITKNKEIYEIDEIIKTDNSSYVFLHLKNAKGLSVKKFASSNNLRTSQLLLMTDWEEKSQLTSVISNKKQTSLKYLSSDFVENKISLLNEVDFSSNFKTAFVFNLNSELVGLFNQNTGVLSVDYLIPIINNLLNETDKKAASLGVNYVNLNNFVIEDNKYRKGALIYSDGSDLAVAKGGVADLAGLVEGDIILSVNNIEIDQFNDLNYVIQQYLEGDEVNIIYLHEQDEKIVKIKLGGISK